MNNIYTKYKKTTLYILIIYYCLNIFNNKSQAQNSLIPTTESLSMTPFSEADICQKYQHLRQRFRERFIRIGRAEGMSIPAHTDHILFNDWSNIKGIAPDAVGHIRWGDGTAYLGDYLAVLATEYHLFKQKGMDTEQTVKELYYALIAFERLDSIAEHHIYNLPAQEQHHQKNGFFIRDDVTEEFVRTQFKRSSFYSDRSDSKTKAYGAVSQDQIIGLLFGITFIVKYVEDDLQYKQLRIKRKAQEIADRMINYLRHSNWLLREPMKGKLVPRGASALFQCYAIAKAGKVITGKNYQNWWSATVSQLSWRLAQRPFKHLSRWRFNNFFRKNKKRQRLIYTDVNNSMMLRLSAISNSWKRKKMLVNSLAAHMEVFVLANAVLFNYRPAISPTAYQDMLRSMSFYGPFSYGKGQNAIGGWASVDRWAHAQNRYRGSDKRSLGAGEYSGLDYMLLYNLYHLSYQLPLSINCKKAD